jgi:hypothetical protein
MLHQISQHVLPREAAAAAPTPQQQLAAPASSHKPPRKTIADLRTPALVVRLPVAKR